MPVLAWGISSICNTRAGSSRNGAQIYSQKCELRVTLRQDFQTAAIAECENLCAAKAKARGYSFSMWMDPSPELMASVGPPAFNFPRTEEWLSEPET